MLTESNSLAYNHYFRIKDYCQKVTKNGLKWSKELFHFGKMILECIQQT